MRELTPDERNQLREVARGAGWKQRGNGGRVGVSRKVTPIDRIDLSSVGSYWIPVSADVAELLLQFNVGNRSPRKTVVESYVERIHAGEWQDYHPAPIVLSDAHRIIDGQHRLMAVRAAQVTPERPIVMRFDTGVPDVVRESIDSGTPRRLEDLVAFTDGKDNRFVSRWVKAWMHTRVQDGYRMSKATVTKAKEVFGEHEEAILWASSVYRTVVGVRHMAVAVAAVEYYEQNPRMADDFYTDLFKINRQIQQSQYLANFLLTRRQQLTGQSGRIEVYRKSCGAMQAHLEGRQITKLYGVDGW